MRITLTQQKMIELAAEGKNTKEIADTLHLSRSTISFHFSELYRDLGFYGDGCRFQLLKFCSFIGLVKI